MFELGDIRTAAREALEDARELRDDLAELRADADAVFTVLGTLFPSGEQWRDVTTPTAPAPSPGWREISPGVWAR